MDILGKLLKELNFREEIHFKFKFKLDGEQEKEQNLDVSPYIWNEHSSQVYLFVELNYKNLPIVLHKEFLSKLATSFCGQQFHKSEMDKNTSLVIKSLGSIKDLEDTLVKIRIEDDPHYFKKYVFAYTEHAEEKACEYFEGKASVDGDGFSLISEIHNLLLNGEEFEKYKNDPSKQEVYSYVVELTTKIPVLPLKVESVSSFKSFDSFLKDELENARNPIKVAAVDKLLSKDIELYNFNTDKFLSIWQECLGDMEED